MTTNKSFLGVLKALNSFRYNKDAQGSENTELMSSTAELCLLSKYLKIMSSNDNTENIEIIKIERVYVSPASGILRIDGPYYTVTYEDGIISDATMSTRSSITTPLFLSEDNLLEYSIIKESEYNSIRDEVLNYLDIRIINAKMDGKTADHIEANRKETNENGVFIKWKRVLYRHYSSDIWLLAFADSQRAIDRHEILIYNNESCPIRYRVPYLIPYNEKTWNLIGTDEPYTETEK